MHLNLVSLFGRPDANKVHLVGCSREDVPGYVHNLLAKSFKFIPQPKCDHISDFLKQKHDMLRKLSWMVKLSNHRQASSRGRLDLLTAGSGASAQLYGESESQLQHFGRMLHRGLAKFWYEPMRVHKPFFNFTVLDKLALGWLQNNANTIRAVESDKNLGIVLTSVSWIYDELRKHLRCFERLSIERALELRARARTYLTQQVQSALAEKAVSIRQSRYLLADINSDKFANLRINVKVHKHPVESRPLSNTRGTFIGPFSLFLNAALLELQDDFTTIVSSSRQTVLRLEGLHLGAHEHFLTFDIKAIYPSLQCWDPDSGVFKVVGQALLRFYDFRGKSALGEFLLRVFKALLQDPLVMVEIDGQIECFKQTSGLPTGLSCSGTVTNIFLACKFDVFVIEELGLRDYSRYIDDGIAVAQKRSSKRDVSKTLNSWHDMIVVPDKDIDLSENVHFLDLRLQLNDARQVYCETFRKDLGIYDYIPPESSHAPGVFRGIVMGELVRLLTTNSNEQSYAKQVLFFMTNLRSRGYDMRLVSRIIGQFPFTRRKQVLRTKPRARRVIPTLGMKVRFCKGLESLPWAQFETDMTQLLHHMIGDSKFRVSYTTGRNVFRLLYRHTWQGGNGCAFFRHA